MPEISRFLGIVIGMFYREHAPGHFHATYGEYEIKVVIETGDVEGRFPKRALRHVLEWHELHKDELLENWELATKKKPSRGFRRWSKTMTPRIVHAEYIQDYMIRVCFGDGSSAEIDFAEELEGEVFEPLQDISYFRDFRVHPELRTLVWPNGADFAPEFLYSKKQVAD